MSLTCVFISDVHILPGDEERLNEFCGFLDEIKQKAPDRFYILGDLFDYWIGRGHEKQPQYHSVLLKIRELADAGIEVLILHGNRDFFLDERVARITGAKIAGHDIDEEFAGRKVHLCHGDHLCRKDWFYQWFRKFLRSNGFRIAYQSCPFFIREFLARKLRDVSKHTVSKKPMETMTFCPEAINAIFHRGIDILICGHTHTHGEKTVHYNDKEHLLFNTGDWSKSGSYLLLEDGDFKLLHYGKDE